MTGKPVDAINIVENSCPESTYIYQLNEALGLIYIKPIQLAIATVEQLRALEKSSVTFTLTGD